MSSTLFYILQFFTKTAYFQILNDKPVQTKLKILLHYIPLLKINPSSCLNTQLRDAYNDQIQRIFEKCFDEKIHTSECYQLTLLASLHPIFDNIQQLSFQKWTELFDEQHMHNLNEPKKQRPNCLNHLSNEKSSVHSHSQSELDSSVQTSSSQNSSSQLNMVNTETTKRPLMRRNFPLEKTMSLPHDSYRVRFNENILTSIFMFYYLFRYD